MGVSETATSCQKVRDGRKEFEDVCSGAKKFLDSALEGKEMVASPKSQAFYAFVVGIVSLYAACMVGCVFLPGMVTSVITLGCVFASTITVAWIFQASILSGCDASALAIKQKLE